MKSVTYEVPLPYKSQANKRKSNALMTVNVQRNLHHKSAANFKLRYAATLRKIILEQPLQKFSGVIVNYTLCTKPTKGKPIKAEPYRGSKPKDIDLLNVGAVVSKVFLDCLTELKIIEDDKIQYVIEENFKSNPWEEEDKMIIEVIEAEPIKDPRI